MGHQALAHHQARAGGQVGHRLAVGGIDALDLDHLHLHRAALGQVHLGDGVQDAHTQAVALAVVLFHIADMGVLAHLEAVDAVVLRILVAAVVDAAAGHDQDVAVVPDEKVVVDRFLQAAFAEDHRDVDALVLGARLDVDVDAGAVGLGDDLDVGGGVAGSGLAVAADVVSPFGDVVQVGHFGQDLLLDVV